MWLGPTRVFRKGRKGKSGVGRKLKGKGNTFKGRLGLGELKGETGQLWQWTENGDSFDYQCCLPVLKQPNILNSSTSTKANSSVITGFLEEG